MELTFLKSKLHAARVTRTEPEYDGSCAVDAALLRAADLAEYEQVDLYNIDNGERLTTYLIAATPGSGIVSVNGAAAHKAAPGDRLIIAAYCRLTPAEARAHRPRLLYLDANNRIARRAREIPAQIA